MFLRKLRVEYVAVTGEVKPCPVRWIDSFAMRNFTNDAVFDDTLPLADGSMEAGNDVPLPLLREKMEVWFRRKGYLHADEVVAVTELPATAWPVSTTPETR